VLRPGYCVEVGATVLDTTSSFPRRRRGLEVAAPVLEAAVLSSRRARRPDVGSLGFEVAALFRGRGHCR
jgi:hypothetical protein